VLVEDVVVVLEPPPPQSTRSNAIAAVAVVMTAPANGLCMASSLRSIRAGEPTSPT
jgi:hypothetical protein